MNEKTPEQPVDEMAEPAALAETTATERAAAPDGISPPSPATPDSMPPSPPISDQEVIEEEVIAEGTEAEALMAQISRRAFLQAGLTTAGVVGGIYAFNRFAPVETTPIGTGVKLAWRRGLDALEAVTSRVYFSESRLAPVFPREKAVTPRNNYHGETPTPDLTQWKLTLEGAEGEPKTFTLADLQALHLEEISETTELKCVEGWSAIVNWSGWRLRDFMEKFPPPAGTKYVALRSEPAGFEETWYYVGLDMPACRHPQTLLATGMNGTPLNADHGAPLRLVIPHKYGIKNIKLITHIAYAAKKPRDYWAERGYDYYAGL